MAEYIEKETLQNAMYHAAFETDTEMQRWDSGCWIRYKLFENILEQQPTADVVEVVRCKDCKHAEIQDYAPPSCRYCCKYSALYHAKNFYCSMGERREDAIPREE